MSQASGRAHQIMLGVLPDQRRQSRVHFPVPARLSRSNKKVDARIAYVRDANVLGAFLYSDLEVTTGESVQVEIERTQGQPQLSLNCEAKVVRVEESAMHGLTGLALEFHGFEIQELMKTELDHSTRPFIRWTVDLVDRIFARRSEFQTCASRIERAS